MRVLVIGGGQFFGAAFVDAAVAAGHTVTVVQRGVTSRPCPEGVEQLRGNRVDDLPQLLAGRAFDAVLDTCGYLARVVRSATALLADVGRYCFISSVSAYAPTAEGGYVEDVSPLDDRVPDTDEYQPEFYGGLKAACEEVVLGAFGDRGLVVRPGLIVGPNDPTDRFTYWPRRLAEPGPVLMAHGPDLAFQVIDARDLAAFVLHLLQEGRGGTVNAVGPRQVFADLVEACAAGTEVVYAEDTWLLERDVIPFVGLPLWIPAETNLIASDERALAWGLTRRPLAAIAAETLAWDRGRGLPPMEGSVSRERERELLKELGV